MSNPLFKTPWTPSLRENALPPCKLVAPLVKKDVRPDPAVSMHSHWTGEEVMKDLQKVPSEAREAVAESILAIWRLYQVVEDGADDMVWEDHLEAYLVRNYSFAVINLTHWIIDSPS
jgi:hypothetical protein